MIRKVLALTVGLSLFFALGLLSAQSINDAQIASIVVTANQVDIDAGKLAATRSSNDAVKKFAQLMVTDHTGVNKAAVDLATKLKVTPQDNATSQSLKADGEKHVAHLKTLSGARFDKAYINKDMVPHTATSTAAGFDSRIVEASKSWRHTVEQKGDFEYVCSFHPTMTAKLHVQ